MPPVCEQVSVPEIDINIMDVHKLLSRATQSLLLVDKIHNDPKTSYSAVPENITTTVTSLIKLSFN